MAVDDPEPAGTREQTPVVVSFADFYEAQYRPAVAIAAALVGRWDVAEELVQDSFLALHARWGRVSRYEAPELWLRRVVLNRSFSTLRRRATELRLVGRMARQRQRHAEPPATSNAEIWRAVVALPKRQAQVMALMFVDDLSVREIAVVLECDENTVRTHYRRGRLTLARASGSEKWSRDHRRTTSRRGGIASSSRTRDPAVRAGSPTRSPPTGRVERGRGGRRRFHHRARRRVAIKSRSRPDREPRRDDRPEDHASRADRPRDERSLGNRSGADRVNHDCAECVVRVGQPRTIRARRARTRVDRDR